MSSLHTAQYPTWEQFSQNKLVKTKNFNFICFNTWNQKRCTIHCIVSSCCKPKMEKRVLILKHAENSTRDQIKLTKTKQQNKTTHINIKQPELFHCVIDADDCNHTTPCVDYPHPRWVRISPDSDEPTPVPEPPLVSVCRGGHRWTMCFRWVWGDLDLQSEQSCFPGNNKKLRGNAFTVPACPRCLEPGLRWCSGTANSGLRAAWQQTGTQGTGGGSWRAGWPARAWTSPGW